ncbi:hypothetical protein A2U01_0076309, partial [Trifolium medium]|nr:hypothetical protein [Trifolium medium]
AWQDFVRVDRIAYDACMAQNTAAFKDQNSAYERLMKSEEDVRAAAPTPMFSMDDFGYHEDDQGVFHDFVHPNAPADP